VDLVFAGEHPRVAHDLMDELAAVLRGDAPSIDQLGQFGFARFDRKGLITLAPKYGLPMQLSSPDRCFAKSPVRGTIHRMVDRS
jgi:hypothetical protein